MKGARSPLVVGNGDESKWGRCRFAIVLVGVKYDFILALLIIFF
jgi:hypothetical protein